MADDGAVCVWDVNDPTRTTSPQLVLRGHTRYGFALAALDDGRLASGGGKEFWDGRLASSLVKTTPLYS